MLALKRLGLVIFVLTMPGILTALLYYGTAALLNATNRVIDPEIVRIAAMIEFAAFSLIAVLEARDRWRPGTISNEDFNAHRRAQGNQES